jgi:hypothetical protein
MSPARAPIILHILETNERAKRLQSQGTAYLSELPTLNAYSMPTFNRMPHRLDPLSNNLLGVPPRAAKIMESYLFQKCLRILLALFQFFLPMLQAFFLERKGLVIDLQPSFLT